MKYPDIANQRGVSIIAVIATMLILSVMGVVLVTMVTTGSDISVNQLRSEQALNIAQGGIEYGLYTTTRGGGSWGEFNFSNRPLGPGSFTLTTNTSITGGRRMTLESTATVVGMVTGQRKIRSVVERGAGEVIINGGFTADISSWNQVISQPAGTYVWSIYPTTGGSPGSLNVYNNVGANQQFQGYGWQAVSVPAGIPATLQMQYCKNAIGATTGGSRMDISVVVVYQTLGVVTLWSDASQPSNLNCASVATWNNGTPPGAVNIAFTPADDITQIRIAYDLRNRGGGAGAGSQKQVWFDSVSLISGGGSGSIPVIFKSVQEVY